MERHEYNRSRAVAYTAPDGEARHVHRRRSFRSFLPVRRWPQRSRGNARRRQEARRTWSGAPTRATFGISTIHRSRRSMPATSTASRSPGASRPTASGRGPSSSSKGLRSSSTASSTRPPGRGAPSSRSMRRRANCAGSMRSAGSARRRVASSIVRARRRLLDRRPREERILYVTTGYRLVALDAKTGARIPGFGTDGIVDLKEGAVFGKGQPIDLVTGEIGVHSTPSITKDGVVMIGSSFLEGGTPKTHNNTKGLVRGYDVRTGQASLDVQHHSAAGRVRQRHVATGVVGRHRQYRCLESDFRR